MKKTGLFVLTIFASFILRAQSVDEARQLLIHERYNSAGGMLHQIIKNDPVNADAWYVLSQVYLQQNKLKEIKDSLSKAPADVLNQPMGAVAMGHVLLKDNQVAEATKYFDAALKETRQKNAAILQAVAKAHYDAGSGNAD